VECCFTSSIKDNSLCKIKRFFLKKFAAYICH
jgi:hypothetical protein